MFGRSPNLRATARRDVSDGGLLKRLAGQALNVAAESRYVSTMPAQAADRNRITRFEVLFETDPFSESSLHALERIGDVVRAATAPREPLEGTTAIGIAGSSSMVHDLKRVTKHDQQQMYVLVTLGVYAILVILLRRPGICLYLIFTVVLGYLASLGLTDLVFHALYRGATPWGGLDWTVGFFLFVILVAVGEDYNIFLMARVIEEERTYGIDRRHAEGRRPYRRHHQFVWIDHGGDVRLDAHGQSHLATRARLCSRAGRAARHIPGAANFGAGVCRSDREDQDQAAGLRCARRNRSPRYPC